MFFFSFFFGGRGHTKKRLEGRRNTASSNSRCGLFSFKMANSWKQKKTKSKFLDFNFFFFHTIWYLPFERQDREGPGGIPVRNLRPPHKKKMEGRMKIPCSYGMTWRPTKSRSPPVKEKKGSNIKKTLKVWKKGGKDPIGETTHLFFYYFFFKGIIKKKQRKQKGR